MPKLVIAEKPSVAQSIAKVIGAYKRQDGYMEGSGYLVSWCVGHLVGLVQPDAYDERYKKWNYDDLPIVPEDWKYEVAGDKKKQFEILKQLMFREDVDELIEATDAGREGELIFRLVYHKAGCKKPFKRLWISSMEDAAIRDGFANLKDGSQYDALYQSALCRSWADWLVGMNGTRLFTTLYNQKLTVGRVQTPTLAMLVDRSAQIDGFQKQKYFNVHLDCDGLDVTKDKVFDQTEAERICNTCQGQTATAVSVKQAEKSVSPPKLYDLTTLQREANRYYGYTAQKTLDYTQSLYEKKLVTYPRTDSQFLTEDMADTATKLIQLVNEKVSFAAGLSYEPDIPRVINNSKVSDHHAIIPTAEISKQDLKGLPAGERDILMLVSMRLLCATAPKQIYSETAITVECAGESFSANGKTVLSEGWKAIEAAFKAKLKEKNGKEDAATVLPAVTEGQAFSSVSAKLSEHFTSPPKAYTEDTLLSAMETAGNQEFDEDTEKKGLGTPATRAAILEKLVGSGFVERKGKQLLPTKDGINLAVVMPDVVKSPKLTADWENTLMQIERGQASADDFMAGIVSMITELVKTYHFISEEEKNRFAGSRPEKEQIGICPRCGKPIYEGQKNYYCSNRECKFALWKDSKFLTGMKKKLTKKMAVSLLKDGKVAVTGLYSQRTGKTFDATLVLDDTGQYINYKLEFGRK